MHGARVEEYHSITGNPTFRTRLECLWNERHTVVRDLLGLPAFWPETSLFQNVVCVAARVVGDNSIHAQHIDNEVIIYTEKALIDVTYIARPGKYVIDWYQQPVYWYDEIKPRLETLPRDHRMFVWGLTTDVTPTDAQVSPMTSSEVPVDFIPGETFIRNIEGFAQTMDLSTYIGTVTNAEHSSYQLGRKFPAGTLLCRNIEITPGYSFRSFRSFTGSPPGPTGFDPSGRNTYQLKVIYEFRKEGWEKWRRFDYGAGVLDWYYVRYNKATYPKATPFPLTDHNLLLTSVGPGP